MSENGKMKELIVHMQVMEDDEDGRSGVRMTTEDEAITITLMFPTGASDEQMAQCVAMVKNFPAAVVEAMTHMFIDTIIETLLPKPSQS